MRFYRRRRFAPSLMVSLLLIFLVSGPTAALLAVAEDPPTQILPNLDLIIIVDESDSMWRTYGTGIQPADRARRAVETLIDALGADTLGSDFRVAIIAYGDEARLVAPLTSLRQPQSQALLKDEFYGQHAPMGWSDAQRAFQVAAQHLQEAGRTNYKPAVILVSDGKPETEFANEHDEEGRLQLPEYLEDVRTAFQEVMAFSYEGEVCQRGAGTPFYTVEVGEAAAQSPAPSRYQNIWADLAAESNGLYVPEAEDIGRLPFIFLNLFGELTCVPVGEPQEVALPADVTLPVFDTYAQFLVAVVALDETVQVDAQLLGPDGRSVQPNGDAVRLAQSDLDQVWGVRRSPGWSGEWTLRLTGNGAVRTLFIPVSDRFTIDFLSPRANTHPVGRPLPIIARLLDSRGQPVSKGVAQFEVDVVNPSTHSREGVLVMQEGDQFRGRYDRTLLAGPTDLGQRDIVARAGIDLEGQIAPVEGVKRLNLVKRPWLEVISPVATQTYPLGSPVPLAVDVRLADRLDPATAQIAEVEAAIFEGDAQVAGPFKLALAAAVSEARMAGQVPAAALAEGSYRVVFTLLPGSTAPEGDQTETTLLIVSATPTPTPSPTATPTPTPTPTPPPPPWWQDCQQQGMDECVRQAPLWLLALCTAIPLVGLLGIVVSVARMPTLNGMYFSTGRAGSEIYLRGGRFRPRQVELGSIEGEPAARLSLQVQRGQSSEEEIVERLAQATIEDIHPKAGELRVSGSRILVGDTILLQDGDTLSVAGQTWTFHDVQA